MTNYPLTITLTKLETLEEAEHPQKEKYPDGVQRTGLMWKYSLPKLGERFQVLQSKLWPSFITSNVTAIHSRTDKQIIFTTNNSLYKVTW